MSLYVCACVCKKEGGMVALKGHREKTKSRNISDDMGDEIHDIVNFVVNNWR